MKRIKVLNESKFEKLKNFEMQSVKGGDVCVSCMKRNRKVPIVIKPAGFEEQ